MPAPEGHSQITLIVPNDMRAELDIMAEEDRRPLSTKIVLILEPIVAKHREKRVADGNKAA